MQNRKTILTGRGGILVVLGLSVLVGCSDARKQEAGKRLRDASEQARQLYLQALNTLSNPPLKDMSETKKDARALDLLDKARNLLTASLSENYDALKGDPDQTPTADAGLAKMMLGLIDRLKAQCYTWQFAQSVLRTEVEIGKLDHNLDKAQACSILLKISETYTTLSDEAVRKGIDDTLGARKSLDKTVSDLQTKIRDSETQIAERKKTIEELTSQAVALRTKKTMTRGAESRKKLEEALKIEARIETIHKEMEKVESELIPLRATLASEKIRQAEAETKIAALRDIQTQRKNNMRNVAKTLDQRKEEFTAACGDVIASMAKIDALSGVALDQADNARKALRQAGTTIGDAIQLLDGDKKAAAYSEQAHAVASQGALQRTMMSYHTSLKTASERLAAVWKTLHPEKPSQPSAGSVAAFIEASRRAHETALSAYADAIKLLEQAVRATPREDNWQYKRELVVKMLDYATFLDQAGHAADATDFRNKARDLFADVKAAARSAGKSRSVVALEKYVNEQTGS